jgi:hypothetical protein
MQQHRAQRRRDLGHVQHRRDQEYEGDGVNHSLENVNQHADALAQSAAGGLAPGIHAAPMLWRTRPARA